MLKRAPQWLMATCLLMSTALAATDSFVGDWKLVPSKCTYIDVMKVGSLGGNKYAFDFGGGPETITVDGTEQPALQGTMLSVTVEGSSTWRVVRKKDGKMLLSATWKRSPDGTQLVDSYTGFQPDGSSSTVNYAYKRTAAGSGFAGTWETVIPIDITVVNQIRPYEGDGLSFVRSPQDTRNLKFDGKDYPAQGGGVPPGATSSGRRLDGRTLEVTDKVNGKVTRTERRELSADLKTMTRTVHPVGQRQPSVFVYERQQ